MIIIRIIIRIIIIIIITNIIMISLLSSLLLLLLLLLFAWQNPFQILCKTDVCYFLYCLMSFMFVNVWSM